MSLTCLKYQSFSWRMNSQSLSRAVDHCESEIKTHQTLHKDFYIICNKFFSIHV